MASFRPKMLVPSHPRFYLSMKSCRKIALPPEKVHAESDLKARKTEIRP